MKKLFAILLSGILVAASVPMSSFAAVATSTASTATTLAATTSMIKDSGPVSASVEPTTSGLQSAILAVKEKVTIPTVYSEFNYYFYDTNSYSDAYWSFTWSNPKDNSSIQVNCDADYHITYYSQYDYSKKTSGVAKYLKSELKSKADGFINTIAPEINSKLEYIGAKYDGIYSNNYIYSYDRKNNGVEFPDNTVSVSVNGITGEVSSASINWLYDTTVPSATTKITKEQATKLIKENMKMKLVYRSNYYRIYDAVGKYATKAYLVYEPSLNYISIDAKTGDVYLTRSEVVSSGSYGNNAKEAASSADTTAAGTGVVQTLTEMEIAKIQELEKLISKAKAISIITGNSYLSIDENLKSYSATLSKTEDAGGKTSYVWNITLSDPREVETTKVSDTYRAYAYATVDAVTGKILSFYSSRKSYYDDASQTWKNVKIIYDKEKSKAILEKFLKKQASVRFGHSVLASENDDYVISYKVDGTPIYGGYNFQYNRVNEGVEYPNNYIYGSVDGTTGKIYSFGSYWNDNVEFESTKSAITADQAMDYYLGKDGYGLKYEINMVTKEASNNTKAEIVTDKTSFSTTEYQIRLVYRQDVTPTYISPFTGELLNYDGEVYKVAENYVYKDIDNTTANRNILLLADMNIGFEGGNFLPNQAVTVKEFMGLLQGVGYGYDTTIADNGLEKLITREELAKLFVSKMGLEKISKLTGIYRTGYLDEDKIGVDYVGAVALAKGLGLMDANTENYFNPKSNITRFEAVEYIMNFIKAQQESILY